MGRRGNNGEAGGVSVGERVKWVSWRCLPRCGKPSEVKVHELG